MINYFENKIKVLQNSNLENILIKEIFHDSKFYHKFYAREDLKRGYKELDFEKVISGINKFSNNIIIENKQWPEVGALYVKCRIAKYHYRVNNWQLIDRFDDIKSYYMYLCDKFIELHELTYPSQTDDLAYGNVAVQEDLSWDLVDFDYMFEPHNIPYEDHSKRMALKFSSSALPKEYDKDEAFEFMYNYLLDNKKRTSYK